MTLLNELGEYGPIILLFLSVMLLWNSKNFLFYYIVGITFNTILNLVLKGIIQEPRPIFDDRKMKLVKSHAKHYFYQNGIPFDMFGMPSGHAQGFFFLNNIYLFDIEKSRLIINIYYFFINNMLSTSFTQLPQHFAVNCWRTYWLSFCLLYI